MRTLLRAVALGAILAAPLGVRAQEHCSRETLAVRGTPVTFSYCMNGAHAADGETTVDVAESYSASTGSFARKASLKFVSSEGPSRVLESLDLTKLGLPAGTLHLTLVYVTNSVSIESAILTPGAITIK